MKQLIPYFIQDKFLGNQSEGAFQAYTIFVDLSGFTPLTERLTKEGVAGAEVLSGSLNEIFAPLIKMVYERGGFIPYFAGDAFTAIFFEEDIESPDEVIFTACKMRDRFDKNGKIFTMFGDFDIRIKTGVSYGSVHWGIVGDRLKSFYFRGEGIDNCAKAEHRANQQDIIIDKHFLSKHPNHKYELECLDEGFVKLLSVPDMHYEAKFFEAPKLDAETVKAFIPKPIIKFNQLGEFRRVTTIFISFEGLVSHETLAQFFSFVIREFEKCAGYFKEVDFGDKGGVIMGFFGAPVSFENNVERALELAFTLKESVRNIEGLSLKIGIASGMAFTGIIGGEERCQYAAVGNRVNIAARLMVMADWGQILIDEEIRKAKQFRYEHKGDIHYKGVENNIPTYEVLGRKIITHGSYKGKIKGRKKELKQLLSFVEHGFDYAQGNIAYVFGEAGTGKSRLNFEVQKLIAKERRIFWISCPADQILQKTFNPFKSALSVFFEQDSGNSLEVNKAKFETNFNDLLQVLESSKESGTQKILEELKRTKSIIAAQVKISSDKKALWYQLDAKGRYENTHRAIVNFFLALSCFRPLVIELEDGHWYDEGSIELINILAKSIQAFPIVLIIASRYNDDGTKKHLIEGQVIKDNDIQLLEIDLGNLSEKSLGKLLVQQLGGEVSSALINRVFQVTNGNPFYIEQTIEFYKEENLLVQKNGQWHLKNNDAVVSDSINSILMARIDRLSDHVKETVKAAAVIGREFDLPILEAVLDRSALESNSIQAINENISEAEKGQIWKSVNDSKYMFNHALLRETVYDMQLRAQLRKLHQRVAETIERVYQDKIKDKYIELAFHYGQAENPVKTVEYLKKTADRAKRNFQNAQAIKYYNELLKHQLIIDDAKTKANVLLSKGSVLELIGEWESCETIYREGLSLAMEANVSESIGRAYTKLGYLLLLKGSYDRAKVYFDNALEHFNTINDDIGIIRVTGNLGNLFFRQGQYRKSLDYFTRTVEKSKDYPYHSTAAEIASNSGLAYMNLGQYDAGIKVQKDQLAICKQHNDRRGVATLYVNLGIVYFEKGDYENALFCYDKGLELAKESGNKFLMSIVIGCKGRVYQQEGDYKKAEDHFVRDLALCEELGDKQGIAIAVGLMGELKSIEGEFETALQYLNKCVDLAEPLNYRKGIAKALNNIGDIYYLKEEYLPALDHYQRAIDVARTINQRLVLGASLVEKGKTLVAMKGFELAEVVAEEARIIAKEINNPQLTFESQALDASLKYHEGEVEIAKQLYLEILDQIEEAEDKAEIHFELYGVLKEEKYRVAALSAYEELYTKTPKYVYKKRIDILKAQ